MLSRFFAALLVATILQPALFAQPPELPDAPSAVQPNLKADLNRFAADHKKVTVQLNSKQKLTGNVQEVGEENFVVTDAKTGQATRVNYAEVAGVKKTGMSTGAKIAIVAGVVAGFSLAMTGIACANGSIHC